MQGSAFDVGFQSSASIHENTFKRGGPIKLFLGFWLSRLFSLPARIAGLGSMIGIAFVRFRIGGIRIRCKEHQRGPGWSALSYAGEVSGCACWQEPEG